MRAAVLSGHGQPLRIMDVAIPTPGPGQILIRLEASGVCHTDVHIWRGSAVPAVANGGVLIGKNLQKPKSLPREEVRQAF